MTEQQGWTVKPDLVAMTGGREPVIMSWDVWDGDELIAECETEEIAVQIATQARRIAELEAALREIESMSAPAGYDFGHEGIHRIAARALLSPASKEES